MTVALERPAGRILVTPRSVTQQGLDRVPELAPLRAAGFELVSGPPGVSPSEDQLLRLVPGCVGWLAGVEPIGARVLAAAADLRIISRNGTGVDNIDLGAAAEAGVVVARAAGANAQGVAELAITLALAALRDVPRSAEALRAGRWSRRPGRELAELRVGVVGLGAVGRRVAALFAALGSSVAGYDPFVEVPDVPALPLDELFAQSDVISLHVPPLPSGPIVTARELATVPVGAVLVNTARAALVDDAAVLAALETGRLGGYAVDAFDTEPPEPSALLAHPAVLATPHLGGYTDASVRRAVSHAVANLLTALAGDPVPDPNGRN
ncbi:MAG: D-3-phosphoglycerate dehydrogenase / 2-oxoglutarate reductase [Microbacteriaceae bacterium]|jgi:D-3-phosphoglycerate dehydrogenase|nr:D-3-phosphoglycerate dehydrogenase / 2-oxoglutarate reductase [Microbacteriaceae bacterium]